MKKRFLNLFKPYKYRSVSFRDSFSIINLKIDEFIQHHPEFIPVSVSVSPGDMTGIAFGVLIYKFKA